VEEKNCEVFFLDDAAHISSQQVQGRWFSDKPG